MASCAVPGLLPRVEMDVGHYFDGGLVDSIPVGRTVTLGAAPSTCCRSAGSKPRAGGADQAVEVGLVAFEIARRHRFHEEMSSLPDNVRVHVLPTGGDRLPPGLAQFRYRDRARVGQSIDARTPRPRATSPSWPGTSLALVGLDERGEIRQRRPVPVHQLRQRGRQLPGRDAAQGLVYRGM